MSELISVGKILNFHGIKGEVKVGYTKGKEEPLKGFKKLFLKKGADFIELNVISIRFHKGLAIIKFKEINSINEVAEVKGCVLYTGMESVKETLDEDEFLASDLKGLSVFDTDGNRLGEVVGVSNNGATDLLSVKSFDKTVNLVPFVKELVPSVSLKDKKVVVNNIEGLLPKPTRGS